MGDFNIQYFPIFFFFFLFFPSIVITKRSTNDYSRHIFIHSAIHLFIVMLNCLFYLLKKKKKKMYIKFFLFLTFPLDWRFYICNAFVVLVFIHFFYFFFLIVSSFFFVFKVLKYMLRFFFFFCFFYTIFDISVRWWSHQGSQPAIASWNSVATKKKVRNKTRNKNLKEWEALNAQHINSPFLLRANGQNDT